MRTRLIGYRTRCDRDHTKPNCADPRCHLRLKFMRVRAERELFSRVMDAMTMRGMIHLMETPLVGIISADQRHRLHEIAGKLRSDLEPERRAGVAAADDEWQEVKVPMHAPYDVSCVTCHSCLHSYTNEWPTLRFRCPRCGAV